MPSLNRPRNNCIVTHFFPIRCNIMSHSSLDSQRILFSSPAATWAAEHDCEYLFLSVLVVSLASYSPVMSVAQSLQLFPVVSSSSNPFSQPLFPFLVQSSLSLLFYRFPKNFLPIKRYRNSCYNFLRRNSPFQFTLGDLNNHKRILYTPVKTIFPQNGYYCHFITY